MVAPWPNPIYEYNRREPSFDLTRRDAAACCGNPRCSSPHSHHHQSLRVGPFGERRSSVVPSHHPGVHHPPPHHHDSRTSIMAEREEENTAPRKRIAVACGRCRKRKIRCSGDPGNGQKCNNCKNAGQDHCLFLRVASTEAPMRNDHTDFLQHFDGTHRYQASVRHMTPAAGFPPAGAISGSPLTSPGDMTYRGSHSGYYSSGDKFYPNPGATVSGWAGAYPDPSDSGDYGLQYNSYSHLSQDPSYMVPTAGPSTSYRPSKGSYMIPAAVGSSYTYEATAPPPPSLDHRSSVSSESAVANLSFSNVSAALPSHLTDRQQQLPAPIRTLPSSAMLPYRESSSYSTGKSTTGATSSSMSPTTPLPDVNGTGYSSFDVSYARTTTSGDVYPPSASVEVFASEAAASLRSQSPGNDIGGSYGYSATPENRRDSGYRMGPVTSSAHHGSAYVQDSMVAGVTAGVTHGDRVPA